MALKLILRYMVIPYCIIALSSCSEFVNMESDNNVKKQIGVPCVVSTTGIDNYVTSRSTANLVETSTISDDGRVFCKFTTFPGIYLDSKDYDVDSRGKAISKSDFYKSYDLYTYLYDASNTFSGLNSSVTTSLMPTFSDEEITASNVWRTNHFWPGYAKKCAFFAYAPYHPLGLNPSGFSSAGWPSFHYNVPESALDQNDLLVTRNEVWTGGTPGIDYANIDVPGDYYEPDSIRFDHACTGVRFSIGDKMAPCIIKRIELQGVLGEGDYWYEDEKWHNVSTASNFVLERDMPVRPGESNKVLNNTDDIFMMIPQTVPAGAVVAITIDDGEEHTFKASIENHVWKKGYTVTYFLSTTKDESSYVLDLQPVGGDVSFLGGTKNFVINSYKKTFYGSTVAVPWELEYTYKDGDFPVSSVQTTQTDIVSQFAFKGDGSVVGENNAITVSEQVARSKPWRSQHTKTLRSSTFLGSASNPIDLSAGKQTANCYVVDAPGYYKFPLVYGNARNADNSANTDAYGTTTFVDHQGVQITSPYIYATNSGANVPHDAGIVWQDAPSLITPSSVKLTADKHYIEFEINKNNICEGNSVLAVRDADNNIMWSWHIWVTDRDLDNPIEVVNDPSVAGALTSYVMVVPLGWCDDEVRIFDKRTINVKVKQTESGGKTGSFSFDQLSADSTFTLGYNALYYQWGRKDPMPGCVSADGVDKPLYDYMYKWQPVKDIVPVSKSIQFPYFFYYSGLNKCWTTEHSIEFWDKGNTVLTVNNNPIHKTIYDPCPSLYTIPASAAFTGFSKNGIVNGGPSDLNISGTFNKGAYFYTGVGTNTIFIPVLGWREIQSSTSAVPAKVDAYGEANNTWINGCFQNTKGIWGHYFGYSSDWINTATYDYCAWGMTVIPVLQ